MKKWNKRTMVGVFALLLLLVTQGTMAFAYAPGFSAQSYLELSLPKLTYVTGENVNACVIVNGVAEPGIDGKIELMASTAATLSLSSLYLPNGGTGNFSITMPSTSGTYTFSARMSVHTLGDPHTEFESDSVTVVVYSPVQNDDDGVHTINNISAKLGTDIVQQKYSDYNPNYTPIVVMYGSGNLTLIAEQFSTVDKSKVKWSFFRSANDNTDLFTYCGGNPTLTQDTTDKLKATLTTTHAGLFYVTVYWDADDSGTYTGTECMGILNVIMVKAVVSSETSEKMYAEPVGTGTTQFVNGQNDVSLRSDQINFGTSGKVRFIGAGADKRLGIDGIVKCGIIGNINAPTFGATYAAAGGGGSMAEQQDIPAPTLDTGRSPAGKGGDSAFRYSSLMSTTLIEDTVNGGYKSICTASDQPSRTGGVLLKKHNITGANLESTSGGLSFTDYICAYSGNYKMIYQTIGYKDWSTSFAGSYNDETEVWTSAGTGITPNSKTEFTNGDSQKPVTVPPVRLPDHVTWLYSN